MCFDAKKAEAFGIDLKKFQDFSDCFGFFFKVLWDVSVRMRVETGLATPMRVESTA